MRRRLVWKLPLRHLLLPGGVLLLVGGVHAVNPVRPLHGCSWPVAINTRRGTNSTNIMPCGLALVQHSFAGGKPTKVLHDNGSGVVHSVCRCRCVQMFQASAGACKLRGIACRKQAGPVATSSSGCHWRCRGPVGKGAGSRRRSCYTAGRLKGLLLLCFVVGRRRLHWCQLGLLIGAWDGCLVPGSGAAVGQLGPLSAMPVVQAAAIAAAILLGQHSAPKPGRRPLSAMSTPEGPLTGAKGMPGGTSIGVRHEAAGLRGLSQAMNAF